MVWGMCGILRVRRVHVHHIMVILVFQGVCEKVTLLVLSH